MPKTLFRIGSYRLEITKRINFAIHAWAKRPSTMAFNAMIYEHPKPWIMCFLGVSLGFVSLAIAKEYA